MTFEAQETSQDDGQPIELYEFRQGASIFRFTNSTIDRVYNAQTYLAAARLDRTQPVRKLDETGLTMKVTMSIHDQVTSQFARGWINQGPETETTIEVFQVHTTDVADELYSLFQGKVRSTKYDNSKVELLVGSLDAIFESQGPRASFSAMCSHQHFDSRCTLVESAFTHFSQLVTVLDPDGLTLTIPGLDVLVAVDVLQGRIRLNTNIFEVRQIVDRPGVDQVRVKYPFSSQTIVGTTVDVIEGCAHDLPTCVLYANVENFGGFPWGVKVNPFTHSRGLDSQS